MDSSAWPSYSTIDHELEAILPHLPPLKSFADYKDAHELRESFTDQLAQGIAAGVIKFPDWTGYVKEDICMSTRGSHELSGIVYHAKDTEPGPVFVYFHGGGWSFGQPEFGEPYTEMMVKELGWTVVSVGYRLSPENVFPDAAEDAIDAVKWVARHASKLHANPSKGFVVGGTSAGANLAAVAAHEAIDTRLSPPLTGVVLMSPCLCHHDVMPDQYKQHITSWEEHQDALVLDRKGMQWFYGNYKPDPHSPLASPLNWSTHKGQPSTYLQVMGMDPFRDSSLIYEHVLKEVGTPTKLDLYKGVPHGAPEFFPMHSVAKKVISDLREGLEWILQQKH